jgi:hypothetical protein
MMQLKHTSEYGVLISPALKSQATAADRTAFDVLIKALKGLPHDNPENQGSL